jgi:hypothetical protein
MSFMSCPVAATALRKQLPAVGRSVESSSQAPVFHLPSYKQEMFSGSKASTSALYPMSFQTAIRSTETTRRRGSITSIPPALHFLPSPVGSPIAPPCNQNGTTPINGQVLCLKVQETRGEISLLDHAWSKLIYRSSKILASLESRRRSISSSVSRPSMS